MDSLGMYKFVKNIVKQDPPALYLAYAPHSIPRISH